VSAHKADLKLDACLAGHCKSCVGRFTRQRQRLLAENMLASSSCPLDRLRVDLRRRSNHGRPDVFPLEHTTEVVVVTDVSQFTGDNCGTPRVSISYSDQDTLPGSC